METINLTSHPFCILTHNDNMRGFAGEPVSVTYLYKMSYAHPPVVEPYSISDLKQLYKTLITKHERIAVWRLLKDLSMEAEMNHDNAVSWVI